MNYEEEHCLTQQYYYDALKKEKQKTKLYRKKPVIVQAYQTDKEIYIKTLEGLMCALPGDYIITGINGEKYPCKPDIFEMSYEEVDPT